ncbi:MAG: ankyrin repeat domain-containing protein [Xanthomonadales bacterium]|nr:hypothetical protein [Xanthomonadales bacterium]MCC6593951.1 ankyrin repeat domain-containing protein [Xanthomonadales bacterium]MCE7932342.1 ankyrin repeat domain-containing protein [Xanthomonadales bacterium PRO6]
METAALQQAITADDVARALELVDADPALLDTPLDGGATPILLALYLGKCGLALALAAHARLPTAPEAAALGDSAALLGLLSVDPAQAQARSPDGFPALALAVFFGHLHCAALLLGAGADPDAPAHNPMRVTPLHAACARDDEELACALARVLLAFAANPNVRQQAGWTPLHAAVHRDHARLVDVLLTSGADPGLRNDAGADALELARAEGRERALAELQRL